MFKQNERKSSKMDTMANSDIKYSIGAVRSSSNMKTIIRGFYDQQVIILHSNDERLFDVEGKIFRRWKNAEGYAFRLLRKKINKILENEQV